MRLPVPLEPRFALIIVALSLSQALGVTSVGAGQEPAQATGSAAGRIDVFKPDGSRQCEPDSGTPIGAVRAQLADAGVEVLAARTTTDGMHHAQVCGAATGRIHVFTIDAAGAETAANLGFLPGAAIGLPRPGQGPSAR